MERWNDARRLPAPGNGYWRLSASAGLDRLHPLSIKPAVSAPFRLCIEINLSEDAGKRSRSAFDSTGEIISEPLKAATKCAPKIVIYNRG